MATALLFLMNFPDGLLANYPSRSDLADDVQPSISIKALSLLERCLCGTRCGSGAHGTNDSSLAIRTLFSSGNGLKRGSGTGSTPHAFAAICAPFSSEIGACGTGAGCKPSAPAAVCAALSGTAFFELATLRGKAALAAHLRAKVPTA